VLGVAAPDVDAQEGGVAVAPLAVLLIRWVTATRRFATAMPLLVKRSSGSSTRLPTMVVWLSAAMAGAPCSCCRLAFGPESLGAVAGGVGWWRAFWMASAAR
jgi:hypothetical protein